MDSNTLLAVATVATGILGALAAWWLSRPKPPATFLAKVEQIDRVLAAGHDRDDWPELQRHRLRLLSEAEAWVHPRTLFWRQLTLALPVTFAAFGIATGSVVGGISHSLEVGVYVVMLTFALCLLLWAAISVWSSWISVSVEAEVRKKQARSPLELN